MIPLIMVVRGNMMQLGISADCPLLVPGIFQDCDFEGRPATPTAPVMSSRSSGNLMGAPNQCHLIITGLDRTGIDPRNLNVTVHFGIDSVHKMGKAAGPIQVSDFNFDDD